MNMTPIIVASIAALAPTLTVIIRGRKVEDNVNRTVREVHDEVRTNHGKRQGEYIEQLADGQAVQSALLITHTRQDESRFATLEEGLKTTATKADVDALRALIEERFPMEKN